VPRRGRYVRRRSDGLEIGGCGQISSRDA
jgi:hypothetical protein